MPSFSYLDEIKSHVLRAVKSLFDITLEQVAVEIPPRSAFGDLAFPIGFELAKRVKERTGAKQSPRALAERIAESLSELPGVRKIEVAGAGYLNLFFDRARFIQSPPVTSLGEGLPDKVIIEHTSINPNKAAHVGHVRNAVLGDALARLLRATGERVEVHNYIDNTGVQVADVVVGFQALEEMSAEAVRALPGKFDYYCWDLYTRVGEFYRQSPKNQQLRNQVLLALELGDNPVAELGEVIVTRIVDCHLDTMERLGIRYDLLPRESEILHLKFWERAFALLKERDVITYETQGRNRGCWVMRADDGTPKVVRPPSPDEKEEDEYDQDKILVRSDGTVGYTGKDIAYHLWKLGRLGVDFNYRPFRTYPDGHRAWTTSIQPMESAGSTRPMFGNGAYYLSVIGSEQSYLQKFVKQALLELTRDPRVEWSAHISYEKVALTPAAIAELGIMLEEGEAGRQRIGMSGRRGLGVKADDLIDRLEARAVQEVATRHPELSAEEQKRIAHQIAIAALRYFLLKFTRTTAIVFDFKEALAFEGETGPYLQYSVVRADSILTKLREAGLNRTEVSSIPRGRLEELLSGADGDDWWTLFYLSDRTGSTIEEACANHEPAILAKFAYQLAQRFNLFYHHYHILSEPDPHRRTLLIHIVHQVREQLARALDLMGIEVPECM